MPRADTSHIAPSSAGRQFNDRLAGSGRTSEAPPAQKSNYELLYLRPGEDPKNRPFTFAERASSWWTRRQNRKRTREELANLINESLGRDFVSVERGWLFEESIGHRLLRDCAPQGLFSITKIDGEAFERILKRVDALRDTIEEDAGRAREDKRIRKVRTYGNNLKNYVLSPYELETIYLRADASPSLGALTQADDRHEGGYPFIEPEAIEETEATLPALSLSRTARSTPETPVYSVQDLLGNETAVTFNQTPIDGALQADADDGGVDLAASKAHQMGLAREKHALETLNKRNRIDNYDVTYAYSHYAEAANAGHLEAQFALGRFLLDARFTIPKEFAFAHPGQKEIAGAFFLMIAARRGHAGAQAEIEAIKRSAGTYQDRPSLRLIFRELTLNGMRGLAPTTTYIRGPDRMANEDYPNSWYGPEVFAHLHGSPRQADRDAAESFGKIHDNPKMAETLYDLAHFYHMGGVIYHVPLDPEEVSIISHREHVCRPNGLVTCWQREIQDLGLASDYYLRALAQRQNSSIAYSKWDVFPKSLTVLEAMARHGALHLGYEIGQIYEEGRGATPRDLAKAIEWYEWAAEKNDQRAQGQLVDLCLQSRGDGGQARNEDLAARWLIQWAQTDPKGKHRLDRIAQDGPASLQMALARAYNTIAAGADHPALNPEPADPLQQVYDEGLAAGRAMRGDAAADDLSEDERVHAISAAVEKRLNEIDPQLDADLQPHTDVDLEVSLVKAYREGLESGSREGPDVRKSRHAMETAVQEHARKQAVTWFGHAARRGDRHAQYAYAKALDQGATDDQQRDIPYTVWMSRAAEQGYAPAQIEMAWFFEPYRDTELGGTAYRAWRARAIAQGDRDARDLPAHPEEIVPAVPENDQPSDANAPTWWPVATSLIKDNLHRCAALSVIATEPPTKEFDQAYAQQMQGLQAHQPQGDPGTIAQEAFGLLHKAYRSLNDTGTLSPDALTAFAPLRDALQGHVQWLGQLAEREKATTAAGNVLDLVAEDSGGLDEHPAPSSSVLGADATPIAKRARELRAFVRLLSDMYDLATDIHRYRQENTPGAEETLTALARQKGLILQE